MNFASRLTRHPIPFDPDRGADALAHLPDLAPELRPLVEGTGGCSPYLRSRIGKEKNWLAEALTQDPDEVRRGLLLETGAVEAAAVMRAAQGADRKLIAGVSVFDRFESAALGADKKSLAIEVTLQPTEKTLTDEEIDATAGKIVAAVEKATGGTLRA